MDSQDRPLPATARKRQQARDDGQAVRSKELSTLVSLGAGAALLWIFAPMMVDRLKLMLMHQLTFTARTVRVPTDMLDQLGQMTFLAVGASVVFAGLVNAISMTSTVISGGWVLSFKPLSPDFARLNPISGFANLFSKQQITNVLKMLLMTTILGWTGWNYMANSFQQVASMMLQPSAAAALHLTHWITTGASLLLLILVVAAVIDVPLQKFFFNSKLKMSHDEVKRENKDMNGSPQLKNKIRAKQREAAQRRSLAKVPQADFVVMNPTHFAVALRYDENTMHAPQVVSKGADLLAMKIREIANAHGVPVLQSPMLARALYAHAELDQTIPSALYTAVAQVLAYVYRLKAALRGEGPMPDQPQPQVPPELDPLVQPHPAEGLA
jgi:flagellar biosynthetic protein FlhB